MAQFGLRFRPGEVLPQDGDVIHMRGMAGIYRITITRILSTRQHSKDGATLMDIEGSRELVEEGTLEEFRKSLEDER